MAEGSLEAPVRYAYDWNDPEFYDLERLDAEMRRVFDVCHGCRRCFNLCDSFPRLFDLIDESESMELDSVDSKEFGSVVDACTLCDMCFMVSCPYVPPHEFNIDFPHLMVRYRAAMQHHGKAKEGLFGELSKTDRNGKLARLAPGLANWAGDTKNKLTRPVMEKTLSVHKEAKLPKFHGRTFTMRAKASQLQINRDAPAFGRKAVLYATCFVNYNNPRIGEATRQVLARNGVETEVVYPGCCGMPQLERGALDKVAQGAKRVAAELTTWIDRGYDVIALVPSCALMLKFEWPLIVPDDENVTALSKATRDVSQYIVDIAKNEGLADGLQPLEGGVALHLACHARAQNIGAKAAEMLRLLPEADVKVIERCSGHGGSWGVKKENFEVALKVGRNAARQAADPAKRYLASECPLAGEHLLQGIERLKQDEKPGFELANHPIELFARAYGIDV